MTAAVCICPSCVVARICRLYSNLIACHMKHFVLCHHGSTRDQYCKHYEVCLCLCEEKQMRMNTCEEREALKNVAALLSSCRWMCMGIMHKCALNFSTQMHSNLQCTCYDTQFHSIAKYTKANSSWKT